MWIEQSVFPGRPRQHWVCRSPSLYFYTAQKHRQPPQRQGLSAQAALSCCPDTSALLIMRGRLQPLPVGRSGCSPSHEHSQHYAHGMDSHPVDFFGSADKKSA